MSQLVIVLGGGVAGMSAAHELVERGFRVRVFEGQRIPGGKARSVPVPNTGKRKNIGTVHPPHLVGTRRKDLPGEHGFRFFPRFYKHVVDTMARIPYSAGRTVADNLVDTTRVEMARFDQSSILLPARFPRSIADLNTLVGSFVDFVDPSLGITIEEKEFFAARIWQILSSCEERRMDEYEKTGWWAFIDAETRSEAYQKIFGFGITRSLVASQAQLASTKTIGDVFVQLVFNIAEPGVSSDRVLNGPTNEVWIQPWLDYLVARGVEYVKESPVRSINVDRGSVRSVTVDRGGTAVEETGDYYVSALPVEVMASLLTAEVIHADPELSSIVPLSDNIEWMNGIQFYLTRDVPITHGHVIYIDSPWALTSISQKQFWSDIDLSEYGDGMVRGVLSVDISNWDTPGSNGKPARECTQEEVKDEVWAQIKRSVNVGGATVLRDRDLHSWSLDPDIDTTRHANREPLLVNLIDTWRLRPEATTGIPNLFLASDYVRTYTDLATMEAANEAARRAVNGIIDASGSPATPCRLWKLHEPEFLEPWRAYDRARYQRGLPWDGTYLKVALNGSTLIRQIATLVQEHLSDTDVKHAYVDALRTVSSESDSLPELLADMLQGNGSELSNLLRDVLGARGGSTGNGSGEQDVLNSILSAVSAALSSAGKPTQARASGASSTGQPTDDDDVESDSGQQARIRFVQR